MQAAAGDESSRGSPDADGEDARRDKTAFEGLSRGGREAEAAVTRLYAAYAPRFRAFLRMRGLAPESTEDIVQDVFMRLIENRSKLNDVEIPRAYLWCSLRNALTDHYRRRAREQAVFKDYPPESEGQDSEFENWLERVLTTDRSEVERSDHLECVARALEQFRRTDPEKAAAIDLVAIEGFEGRGFADAIGKSYGAAREFLSQARKALRTLVEAMCGGLFA